MELSSGVLQTIAIMIAGLLTWALSQLQAKNRDNIKELRFIRKGWRGQKKYIFMMESKLMDYGIDLPEKPQELQEVEKEGDWS